MSLHPQGRFDQFLLADLGGATLDFFPAPGGIGGSGFVALQGLDDETDDEVFQQRPGEPLEQCPSDSAFGTLSTKKASPPSAGRKAR